MKNELACVGRVKEARRTHVEGEGEKLGRQR